MSDAPAARASERPLYRLTLRPEPDVDGTRALRQALKDSTAVAPAALHSSRTGSGGSHEQDDDHMHRVQAMAHATPWLDLRSSISSSSSSRSKTSRSIRRTDRVGRSCRPSRRSRTASSSRTTRAKRNTSRIMEFSSREVRDAFSAATIAAVLERTPTAFEATVRPHRRGQARRQRNSVLRGGAMWTEALELARNGVPVFPCINRPGDPSDKAPLTPHGFKDATCDPDIVHRWWTRWPNALIGVPAGDALRGHRSRSAARRCATLVRREPRPAAAHANACQPAAAVGTCCSSQARRWAAPSASSGRTSIPAGWAVT